MSAKRGSMSLTEYLRDRAAQIHYKLQRDGRLQVRWTDGRMLTFRYPAPNGFGTRGTLVAVYSSSAKLEWIEEDLLTFAKSLGDTEQQNACAAC